MIKINDKSARVKFTLSCDQTTAIDTNSNLNIDQLKINCTVQCTVCVWSMGYVKTIPTHFSPLKQDIKQKMYERVIHNKLMNKKKKPCRKFIWSMSSQVDVSANANFERSLDEIFDILKDCQRDDPIFRPTFDYLKNHLKTIAQNNKQILLTPTKTTNYRISDVPITPQPRSAFVQSPLYFHR